MIHTSGNMNSKNNGAQWVMPALLILIIQIALYIWMAPRGFDFTDEAFYFQNFLYWREFTGTVTFFGAYFEWPFRVIGMSIGGIRILSMVFILASSAVLMQQVLRFSMRASFTYAKSDVIPVQLTIWHLVGPMASAMLYFGFLTTLRAPSYNLLSLCSMEIATACLLYTMERHMAGCRTWSAPLLYGLALGACALSKATSAPAMILVHGIFFIAMNRTWHWRILAEIFGLVLLGTAVNFLFLTIEHPQWVQELREGLEITRIRGGYGSTTILREFIWDFQHALELTMPWLALFGAALAIFRRALISAPDDLISLLTTLIVGFSAVVLVISDRNKIWLVVMATSALVIWILEVLRRPQHCLDRSDWSELTLMAMLFLLPLAFSFGTNLSVLAHSIIASVFALCAVYLRLYRMAHQGVLSKAALAICICLLCIPAFLAQITMLTDLHNPYRRLRALIIQDIPVAVGPQASQVRVDVNTNKTLGQIAAMSKEAGFTVGQDLLDLTGDGPGVVYALGANPLGTPWMLGGARGSTEAAERIIEKLDKRALSNAWLLTSTDNPRRIQFWDAMLVRKIGIASHVLAASIDIESPYTWYPGTPKHTNLQLWKPIKPDFLDEQTPKAPLAEIR